MASTTEFEGTWEEIAQHAEEFAGHRVRVTVLAPEQVQESISDQDRMPSPNVGMQKALEEIKKRQKGMPFTSGDETQNQIREARSGAMYGYASED